ncbi:hypothetical protein LNTAR_10216 [Lentisphaera araneosa HTCC2155]|uniref:Uncharacterized protein n=1 Tax=Lentisphaera araneosa HTCC2155 TaxID=313628 RepID=A6DIJ6_9BACT|nr:hypothetical protein [Lentisphaera araneosa]EDM28282.1 hypothetical protein LNTAR_10216 [Lentisphaera araneosa HTCC2155]
MSIIRNLVLFMSLSSLVCAEELKDVGGDFSHQPEFTCVENYEGSEAKVRVTCENKTWSIQFQTEGWSNEVQDYAKFVGTGGGGVAQIFQEDVNNDGVKEFVTVLYKGEGNGDEVFWNEVIFWFKDGTQKRTWVKDFDHKKMRHYLKTIKPKLSAPKAV